MKIGRENRSISAENTNYSSCYQIHDLEDNIYYETFPANSPIIAHFTNIILWMGKPDFREGQVQK